MNIKIDKSSATNAKILSCFLNLLDSACISYNTDRELAIKHLIIHVS